MSLSKVRCKINSVDDNMKQLFDERMECSNQVAKVKIAEDDKVFKPLREKEIAERFADDKEYLTFIKKVMQISRRRQYGIFLDRVASVSEELRDVKADILDKGFLELKLKADDMSTDGLNVNDVLSVIADTSLHIKKLNVDESGMVHAVLDVEDNERCIREAMVLAYMLGEETL
ncbi:MAG: hypothetical protein E7257_07785 [Lachnospiraceae bacterium]|nr:hypothetical protein [Lachnospiraceae bacterium]